MKMFRYFCICIYFKTYTICQGVTENYDIDNKAFCFCFCVCVCVCVVIDHAMCVCVRGKLPTKPDYYCPCGAICIDPCCCSSLYILLG